MNAYGLILAGGGAKGIYQIGAYKALLEMDVQIEAIAGTSIGAINGALIASGDFEGAMEMWSNVTLDKGVCISRELRDPNNLFIYKNFPALFIELIKNGGLDASPTMEMLSCYIDEDKVRQSGINYGLVTYSISNMKSRELFLEDIPHGQLLDYILASSHIPGVKKIGPKGEKFLDGGVVDNAPIALLKKRGYNRLIVIDNAGMKGVAHKKNLSCVEVVYIRPYVIEELGVAFDFDKNTNEFRFNLGYYDTKKSFGEYLGLIFYFDKTEYRNMVLKYGSDTCEKLEFFAKELDIPRFKIYSEDDFLKELKSAVYQKIKTNENFAESKRNLYQSIKNKIPLLNTEKSYNKMMALLDNVII